MNETNTGGPAFPTNEERFSNGSLKQEAQPGMTLRDYFAAKAMQGFISRGGHYECDFDAARAYAFADAMLKARQA
jgi:hypothetical protein